MALDISKCGYHGREVLRSDQEPALQDLMGEVARLRGDLPTVLEASPVGDSQSNGFVERAVRSVEEMIRDSQDRVGSLNRRETQHQSLRNWLDDLTKREI